MYIFFGGACCRITCLEVDGKLFKSIDCIFSENSKKRIPMVVTLVNPVKFGFVNELQPAKNPLPMVVTLESPIKFGFVNKLH